LGHPVLVGVDHTNFRENAYNTDKTTDHFIVIIGRGYQKDKAYYLFMRLG